MRSCLHACAVLAGACSTDAPPPLIDANPQGVCLVPPAYGALGARKGTPNVPTANSLTVVLDAGPPRDDFFVKLVAGKGAFAGGITTGTFPITGADASFTNCGLCIDLIADIVSGQGPSKFYAADMGSVTLTATNPIAGSAQNLHLIDVDITGTPLASGCSATITSISFGP